MSGHCRCPSIKSVSVGQISHRGKSQRNVWKSKHWSKSIEMQTWKKWTLQAFAFLGFSLFTTNLFAWDRIQEQQYLWCFYNSVTICSLPKSCSYLNWSCGILVPLVQPMGGGSCWPPRHWTDEVTILNFPPRGTTFPGTKTAEWYLPELEGHLHLE